MIWKNLDSFSVFSVLRAKTFRTRKNFPGSNATLLPRFLRLWKIIVRPAQGSNDNDVDEGGGGDHDDDDDTQPALRTVIVSLDPG